MRKQAGFTLIELIACIVILGLIGFGATTVITLGARSFFAARNADNAGTSAQLAMERIALELREANGGPGAGGTAIRLQNATSIEYTTANAALPGTRALDYNAATGTLTLTPATGATPRTLISGLSSCAASFSAAGRASSLTVTFTMTNAPTGERFTITVKPRNNTANPVTL